MRKPILILISFLIITFVHAQGTFPTINNGLIKDQIAFPPAAGPVYDSIYHWFVWSNEWTPEYKICDMIYDASSNLTSELYLAWDLQWVNSMLVNNTYDENGNLDSCLVQYWINDGWVNFSLDTYTYDENGNKESWIYEEWNSGGGSDIYKREYTYDASNDLIAELWQEWNNETWVNRTSYIYSYNSSHSMTNETHLSWNNGSWENIKNTIYTYDEQNNLVSILVQFTWGDNTWRDSDRTSYSYNIENQLESELTQHWDFTAWQNIYLKTYTYDDHSNLATMVFQLWNETAWEDITRYLYTYDEDNRLIYWINENMIDGSWIYQWHYSCTFDANSSVISEAFRSPDSGDSTRYYLHGSSSVHDLLENEQNFNVFPNPVKGKMFLSSKEKIDAIEIFNPAGNLVYFSHNIDSKPLIEIDFSGEAKGIYLMRISSGKRIVTQKVILQ